MVSDNERAPRFSGDMRTVPFSCLLETRFSCQASTSQGRVSDPSR